MRGGFVAAVDIGATNVRVAIINTDGEIEARRQMATPGGAPASTLETIARTVDELVRGVWVGARADAIGVALPGLVDPAGGLVASVANMPGWDSVPIARLLGEGQGRVVAVENDANAAAVGEGWTGAARGLRDYVFIALGTGIGAGVVADGRLLRGAHGLAGEVAYFAASRDQVRQGGWDNNIEALVGGRAVAERAPEILGEPSATAADLFAAADAGLADAAAWLREFHEHLAMAVTAVGALLDPAAVVFGGGVAAAQGERLLGPVRDLVRRSLPAPPELLLSQLGADAQLVGAARLALDREGIVGR